MNCLDILSNTLHILLFIAFSLIAPSHASLDFSWSQVASSTELKWHPCYNPAMPSDSAQQIISSYSKRTASCARLTLPLDYRNASNSHSVNLAVMKLSPTTSLRPSSPKGTIFILFGGAGNSRIQDALTLDGMGLFNSLDPDHEYDFLTFDNRGFGYSQPSAKCFRSVLETNVFEERMNDLTGILSTEGNQEGLNVRLAAAEAKGRLCDNVIEDKDADIRRHMSTAYAARDIFSISEKFEPQNNEEEQRKVSIITMSYGTVVGLTFASLYPERVSRIVLDGSVNAADWVSRWQMSFLNDTDKLWSTFFTDCFSASDSCPLFRSQDTGPEDIQNRVNGFLEYLKRHPRYAVERGNARLITYRDVRSAMVAATYAPVELFSPLARTLDDLIRGFTNISLSLFASTLEDSTDPGEENEDVLASSNLDAGAAINCGDAADISNVSLASFSAYLAAMENQSWHSGFFQAERRLRCLGWPRSLAPAWRFTGPFVSPNTSIPLLFIGNTLDPMTPINNAHEIAKGFPGSVVVEQRARGHCALANTVPSEGILEAVRKYLGDGKLPASGTVFGEECNVFDGSCPELEKFSLLSNSNWL